MGRPGSGQVKSSNYNMHQLLLKLVFRNFGIRAKGPLVLGKAIMSHWLSRQIYVTIGLHNGKETFLRKPSGFHCVQRALVVSNLAGHGFRPSRPRKSQGLKVCTPELGTFSSRRSPKTKECFLGPKAKATNLRVPTAPVRGRFRV